MPIAETAKLVYELVFAGNIAAAGSNAKAIANVFHFRRTSTVNTVSKAAVAAAFKTSIGDIICAALHADFTQSSLTIRCLNDSEDLATSFAHNTVGAIAGQRLPTHVTVSMGLRTDTRGRYATGAKRFSPFAEADTTGDVLTGAGLTRWQTLQAAMLAGFTDATPNTWVPVVVSKFHSTLQNPTNIFSYQVNNVVLNKRVSRLKRRQTVSVF